MTTTPNMKRATLIAKSVMETLDNPFNIMSNTQAVSHNLIEVKIIDRNAEDVKKIMDRNYCESLVLYTESSEDGVTKLTYNCYPFMD